MYSAHEAGASVSFNQLHKEDNGRIGYQKYCKSCGEIVKKDDIVKGYQYEPDQYVLIEDEEFEKLRMAASKVIEIEGFVDAADVHPTLFESPYYAGPDGPVAASTYALLRDTLRESGKVGIGRAVLRDRESVMLLTPHKNGLLIYKLRFPNEIRDIDDVPQLDDATANEKELDLAKMLVETMSVSIEDMELQDRYNEKLIEMVKAKVEGKEYVTVAEVEEETVDIMQALKKSIEKAKSQARPMEKAEGAKASKARRKTGS